MSVLAVRFGKVNSSRGVCDRYNEHDLPQPSDHRLFGPDSMQTCRHDFLVTFRVCLDQCDLPTTAVVRSGNGRASSRSTEPSSEAHSGMRQMLSDPTVLFGALR
jgi:hypothetical protein